MDKKLKKLTGAVSVDGNVTPTLREPIQQVKAQKWTDMSTSDLWEQKYTLQTRIQYAAQSGHPELINQINRGILAIDEILRSRSANQDELLL